MTYDDIETLSVKLFEYLETRPDCDPVVRKHVTDAIRSLEFAVDQLMELILKSSGANRE